MKAEYDFSKSKKNPYAARLKRQISLKVDIGIIDYFKRLAKETGIGYQNLINLYLFECTQTRKRPVMRWEPH